LRAAARERPSNLAISREIGCDHDTLGQWRRRCRALGLSGLQDAVRSGRPKGIAAPTRVHVISVARPLPHEQARPGTRWTLEAIAPTVCATLPSDPLSRSSRWRSLPAVDLKPHTSAYGRHSHDEAVDAKAHALGQLYVKALEAYAHGRLGRCCDAPTGMQVLERKAPPRPAQPGRRERREQESLRHGTRALIKSLAVATGPMAWPLGATRTATDFVAHLTPTAQHGPRLHGDAWRLDNLKTHWRLDVGRGVAQGGTVPFAPDKRKKGGQRRAFLSAPSHRHGFHCTPKHGSWRNQAEWCLGPLQRRFLARGSFRSLKDFERRGVDVLNDAKRRHAHPYRWTDTAEPLVRATPLSCPRRQQRQGRACFRPRPKRVEKLCYAPRPYRRQAA